MQAALSATLYHAVLFSYQRQLVFIPDGFLVSVLVQQ